MKDLTLACDGSSKPLALLNLGVKRRLQLLVSLGSPMVPTICPSKPVCHYLQAVEALHEDGS